MELRASTVDAIRREGDALGDAARDAGVDAPVPSCPEWNVADLLGHVGRLHRWVDARSSIDSGDDPTRHWSDAEPPPPAERVDWFADGRRSASPTRSLRVDPTTRCGRGPPTAPRASGPAARRTRPRCTAGTRRLAAGDRRADRARRSRSTASTSSSSSSRSGRGAIRRARRRRDDPPALHRRRRRVARAARRRRRRRHPRARQGRRRGARHRVRPAAVPLRARRRRSASRCSATRRCSTRWQDGAREQPC